MEFASVLTLPCISSQNVSITPLPIFRNPRTRLTTQCADSSRVQTSSAPPFDLSFVNCLSVGFISLSQWLVYYPFLEMNPVDYWAVDRMVIRTELHDMVSRFSSVNYCEVYLHYLSVSASPCPANATNGDCRSIATLYLDIVIGVVAATVIVVVKLRMSAVGVCVDQFFRKEILIPGQAQHEPIFISCHEYSRNYTSGSQFESNLINLVLPALVSINYFVRFTTNLSGSDPDIVYGLAQCRDDVLLDDCINCLKSSSVQIIQKCVKAKEASIRFDYCLLRYSDINFFSQMDVEEIRTISSSLKSASPIHYSHRLVSLLNNLTSLAMSKKSRFETGVIVVNEFTKIYGLAQCTQDLSSPDCASCLQRMITQIPKCCDGRSGGQVLSSSCYIRFEEYQFFQPLAPPPDQHPMQPTDAIHGNGLNDFYIYISLVAGAVLLLLALCIYFSTRMRRTTKSGIKGEDELRSAESFQYDLITIKNATNVFSDHNKLGEGGFGVVYKGELPDGQEIAVKRLSANSRQGSKEFRTEVLLLLKLQHRNLVKLLGFCLEDGEKILIYEYIPNRSLDQYLCDPTKRTYLNWEIRYKIIGGIARGLLYLHEDSRLRIIHRDLKTGNILLDDEMNAKIADFGMAKLFGMDQTRGNTSRIAGTFGYMAPEYALHGLFSVKSDVYSFGVLVLEIISGQKINSFCQSVSSQDLLSYAWRRWKEGTSIELMDSTIMDSFSQDEVMRSIHIGLLCVQENIEDRPTMSTVVLMLNSVSVTLSSPSQPAFFSDSTTCSIMLGRREFDQSRGSSISFSENELPLGKTNPR